MINITRPLTPKSIGKSISQHPYKSIQTKSNQQNNNNNTTTTTSGKSFVQEKYPSQLYESEIKIHNQSLAEYDLDIYDIMVDLIETNKPNLTLYKQQPYLTFTIRLKLIDFLLKMSIRLKILPFVFFKAVKIFDRYCSKRIVLLDQSQLIITTCLWIASKIMGGNNHFVNINNLDKIGHENFRTISDLGYGCGGKYLGPTERFRLPKLHELVKLCGAKCKYDQGMFKQMEVHVLNTLDWSLNDPSIEEFIIDSHEFNITNINSHEYENNNITTTTTTTTTNTIESDNNDGNEFFKIKEFLSYAALYSHDLIDTNIIELGQVIMDLINETFQLQPCDNHYQTILNCDSQYPIRFDMNRYKYIKKAMIKSVLNASDFMMKIFNSKGPQYIYEQFNLQYKLNYHTNSIIGFNNNNNYSTTSSATATSTPTSTSTSTSTSPATDNINTTPTNSNSNSNSSSNSSSGSGSGVTTTPISSYIGYSSSRSSSVSSTSSAASSNANTPNSSSCSTTSTTPLGMTPHKRQKNYSNSSSTSSSSSSSSSGLNNGNSTISPVDSTTNSHMKNLSQSLQNYQYQYHNKPSLSVSIPPPQMHSHNHHHHHHSTVYQMVTPPNLANKNSNKQSATTNNNNNNNNTTTTTNGNNQLPAPHQLSYNNYFNSPNMQPPPPPMKYTPGRKQQQQQQQLYQSDNSSINSKLNSNNISSSAASIASSISTNNYDNDNDLFSSSRRFMNYSNYSSSTISGSVMSGIIGNGNNNINNNNNNGGNNNTENGVGVGTPISENDSPIYTKTRLCNMIH